MIDQYALQQLVPYRRGTMATDIHPLAIRHIA